MTAADLRGFRYALEPLRQRGEWQIESVLSALADVQRRIEEHEQQRRRLVTVAEDQARALTTAGGLQVDASARRCLIEYLASNRAEIARVDRDLDVLRQRLEELSADHAQRRRKLDMLDEDRARAVTAYSRQSEARAANEADAQWLNRVSPQGKQREQTE